MRKPHFIGAIALLSSLGLPVIAQTPANWKTTQDHTGSCQISFPASWSVTPDGQATTAAGGRAVVVFGSSKPLEPLDAGMQKLMQVDQLIENTSSRLFYRQKPQNETVQYIVDQQFKGLRCRAQIFAPKGYPDDEIRKIVATLAAKH